MKVQQKNNLIFGRIEKGEEIITALKELCRTHHIKSGFINGLGAAEDVQIAYYDVAEKQYHHKLLKGDYEIVSMSGTISAFDGEPHIHLHIALGDEKFGMMGGHLDHGIVSLTCEFMITDFGSDILRKADPETGLNLLDF
jgi:predicted DNA-binding protein with PD1-like motif